MNIKKLVSLFVVLLYCNSCASNVPRVETTPLLQPSAFSGDASVLIDRDSYLIEPANISEIYSSDASLATVRPENGERMSPLRTGQPSPYDGILLNGQAAAFIEVQFRSQRAQCMVDRQSELRRLSARALTDIEHLQIALTSQERIAGILLDSREREIQRLNESIRNAPSDTGRVVFWSVGTGVAVLGIVGVIFAGLTLGR